MKISELVGHLQLLQRSAGDMDVMVMEPDYGDYRHLTYVSSIQLFPVNEEHTRFDNGGKPKGERFNAVELR